MNLVFVKFLSWIIAKWARLAGLIRENGPSTKMKNISEKKKIKKKNLRTGSGPLGSISSCIVSLYTCISHIFKGCICMEINKLNIQLQVIMYNLKKKKIKLHISIPH